MEDDMMVMMRKKQSTSSAPSNSSSPPLGILHKDNSHNMKPKIRIIHIFAPEIIKTDVENFRELVQRLTGKPSPADQQRVNKKPRIPRKQKQQQPRNSTDQNIKKATEQMVQIHHEVKEEEEMWKSSSNGTGNSNSNSNSTSSGGFLSGFADLDGFIHELDHFTMMHPIGPNNHMLAFGESQLA